MRSGPTASLVGRDDESERINQFLLGAGRPTFVLLGEPGIGKTALWEHGLELARDVNQVVLATRATEAETSLSFAALGDLVDAAGSQVLDTLRPPQRHALEIALRQVDPEESPPDPLAIAAGFMGAVRSLASQHPVLIAIDDVQWLDDASAAPVSFALRRLCGPRVRVLLSRRPGPPSSIESAMRALGVDTLEISGLSFGAVSRLLSDRLAVSLQRRAMRELYDTCKGNPLFAIELGRMLVGADVVEPGAELPLPRLIDEVFGDRVTEQPDAVRSVLLASALCPGLSRDELTVLGDAQGIEDALRSELLVLDGERVRPSHPLIAAAIRKQSTATERQQLHLRLAATTADPVLHARHLALATFGPDADVAATVAGAAELATHRGAAQEAEELDAHALRLTPPDAPERADRVLSLARGHLVVGDLARAKRLLLARMDELPHGRARGLAYVLLSEADDVAHEEPWLERALAEPGDDPEVRALTNERHALVLAISQVARLDEAEVYAREALRAAESVSAVLVARVLPSLAWALALRGRPLDEVVGHQSRIDPTHSMYEYSVERPAAVRLAFRGEVERARDVFTRLAFEATERGEFRMTIVMQVQLMEVAIRAGDVDEARRLYDEMALSTVNEELPGASARFRALIGAAGGDPAEARRWADALVEELGPTSRHSWDEMEAARARGLAAVFDQQWDVAVDVLGALWDRCRREHIDDPGAFPVAADLVEALVRSGRMDRAGRVTKRLKQAATEQDHPWGLATVSRCEGLIGLADHYDQDAVHKLRDAAVAYERHGLDFDVARTRLALGRDERRHKKNGDARRSLELAAATFQARGCAGWAELTRGELARVSGRRATPAEGLTPSERQVATLAAEGMSNKEIAARLSVTVHTVEAHLSHAYAKFGIRSRGQLARAFDQG